MRGAKDTGREEWVAEMLDSKVRVSGRYRTWQEAKTSWMCSTMSWTWLKRGRRRRIVAYVLSYASGSYEVAFNGAS